jgi:ankyrin repeat protein
MNENNVTRTVDEEELEQRLDSLIERQEWDAAAETFREYPAICCRKHRHHGWTKLHWLCSLGGTPDHILDFVASLYPEAVSMQDTYIGDTCLHLVCRNSQFSANKLQNLLKNCVAVADTVLIRNRMGGTALHSAANHNAVVSALELLVDANPTVLQVTTYEGVHAVTALWLAYVQTIPGHMTVVRVLNGETVESQSFERFWCKVEYLATRYFAMSTVCPEKLEQERLKDYVLHGLFQCSVPINLVKVCLKFRPASAHAVDAAGNFPLHLLIENRPYRLKEREAVEACLEANTTAAGIPNRAGDVPLQIAIRNKIPVPNGIDLLLASSPCTVRYKDSATGLYPFQLAATQGSNASSVNTTFQLLTTQPDLVVASAGTNGSNC